MSSSGGGSGIGGGSKLPLSGIKSVQSHRELAPQNIRIGDAQITPDGLVLLNGESLDPNTDAGHERLKAGVTNAALERIMEIIQYKNDPASVGTMAFGDALVDEHGHIIIDGRLIDPATVEGFAALKGAVSGEDLILLLGVLNLEWVDVNAGNETVQLNADVIVDGNQIQLGGEIIDASTPEGFEALRQAVTDEELEALKGMLMLEVKQTDAGLILAPDDRFEPDDTDAIRKRLGPTSTTNGATETDTELGTFFVEQGMANPYNANTTPALYQQISGTQEFTAAVNQLTVTLANPSQSAINEFNQRMRALETAQPHGNIMEVLFLVFRESIKETNEEKKYFLIKLQEFNKMAEALSEYLSDLVKVSRDLGARAAGAKYPEMVLTASPVNIKKFDLSTLGADGTLNTLSTESKRLDRAGLNDTIKEVEAMQETVRNKRQMATTAFQNFDQKSNQLYNLMASVMKAFNEMRMGTVRNFL